MTKLSMLRCRRELLLCAATLLAGCAQQPSPPVIETTTETGPYTSLTQQPTTIVTETPTTTNGSTTLWVNPPHSSGIGKG